MGELESMLKGDTIYLRLIEPEDLEKTYEWHNDYEIQKMTCGPIRFVSKEIEKNWIMSKTSNNQKDIYLSVCLIENNTMIGLVSINDIDYVNRKCRFGGIVIGDKKYRDGIAYREANSILKAYVFEQLNMHKLTGACLENHFMSRACMELDGYQKDGILRDEVFKDGKYHNVITYSLLDNDYYQNKTKWANLDEYTLALAKTIHSIKKEASKKRKK